MNLSSINPFIRYAAMQSAFSAPSDYSISYDSRLFYFHSGKCELNIKDRVYELLPGCLMLWQSGTPYKFLTRKNSVITALNFDFTQNHSTKKESISPVFQKDFNKKNLIEEICFSDFDVLNSPMILCNMQHLEPKINIITDEFAKKKLGYDSLCSALLKEIICDAVRANLVNVPGNSQKIEKVVRYIEQYYRNDISNAELSAIAGYHAYHLNRLMKSATGMTLHRYILNVRLQKAKDYLLNTDFGNAEIADLCGFSSAYHFCNAFSKKVGISPSAFRKSRKNIL